MLKKLIDLCVSRRFAVLAFTAGIAAYGFRAYTETPIEAFPDVTNYQINVITKAPGPRARGGREADHAAARARAQRHARDDLDALARACSGCR